MSALCPLLLLLSFTSLALGTTALPAQEVRAQIELVNGRVIVADVVRIEHDCFVVRFDGRELEIASERVESLFPLDGRGSRTGGSPRPAPWEVPAAPGVEMASADRSGPEDGFEGPRSGTQRAEPTAEQAAEQSAGPAAVRAAGAAQESDEVEPLGPDAHLVDLLERYLWIVPSSAGHLTSIGAGLLLLMSWLLMASARAVGLEAVTFPRCLLLAGLMLGVLAVEASVLPVEVTAVAGALVVDIGLFVVLTAVVLRARLGQAVFVVTAHVFFAILLVMLSELAGVLISARGMLGGFETVGTAD